MTRLAYELPRLHGVAQPGTNHMSIMPVDHQLHWSAFKLVEPLLWQVLYNESTTGTKLCSAVIPVEA